MKKILLGATLFGALSFAATGCIFVSDDDGGDGDGDGTGDILLSWTTDPGCPVGGDTAQLVAAPTGGGQNFINLFNCVDGSGQIDDLPPGTYDVFINITSDDEATLFAQSFSEPGIVVGSGDLITVDAFTILTEDAFFGFDWEISENGTLVPDCTELADPNYPDADCNAGGAAVCPGVCDLDGICRIPGASVGILATFVTDSEVIPEDEFTCAPTGSGQAGPFPLGAYENVIFSILNAAGEEIVGSTPIPTADLAIGNEIQDLGTTVFDFVVN